MEKNKNVKEITIKIEGKEWQDALDKAFEKANKKVKIDGFRQGKAPKEVFIKKYGEESLFMDAADLVLQPAYQKMLDENKDVEIVAQPEVALKSISKDGVEFVFTITTKPEVKLGKYKKLGVKKEKVEVTKEEIESALNETLNTFIPGFEDQIIGMSKDEEKDINVTFPEDYHSEDLKGQKVVFKVKVNEIKTTKIPELDKDFFEDLAMEGIDSKESLEKQLEENIKAHKEQHAEDHYIDELLKKGIENMEVDIPEAMINEELDRMIRQYEENLKMQGLTLQQFYQFTNSDEAALKEQMKEEAEKRVASRLLLEAIKVEEKIEIADDEAKKEAEELAKKYNMEKDEFLKLFGGIEMVKYDMEMRRAIEILKENN